MYKNSSAPTPTFFWHDYETSGVDPMRDRPLQFAGIRTDMDLNVVDDPVMFYCQPAQDGLPHPQAALITGITPQQCEKEGLIEAEFAARVHAQLGQAGTCGVGYNSLRFDDNVTRHLLYRHFYDPYAREWQNGNSRWDIIDLARMCYALRPGGIHWQKNEDGTPSFRLEVLAKANQLEQTRAHDALSDVEATIALARLIKARQPKLWQWYFNLRRKRVAFNLVDLTRQTPLVHVSSYYPARDGCLRLILPLTMHPSHANEVIVADLSMPPEHLIKLDTESITDRVFTPRADLPEDVAPVGIRTIHMNRSPALAPINVLKGVDHERIHLNLEQCLAHAKILRQQDGLAEKVRQVYAHASQHSPSEDAELALYARFLSDTDRPKLEQVRATPPDQLDRAPAFSDPRYNNLLFRYRARNWPETLNADEWENWKQFCHSKLTMQTALTTLTLEDYFTEITSLRQQENTRGEAFRILDQLEAWGHTLKQKWVS